MQRTAFHPHYSKFLFMKVNVGLNQKFERHPQVILVDGDYQIDDELSLFTINDTSKCYSNANDSLYQKGQKDDFLHEHNLVINERKTVVIMGCGHAGVANIMEKAISYHPQFCIGGYHLFNPLTKKTVSQTLLNEIVKELQRYHKLKFYTCHCTGTAAFQYLSQKMPNMFYLSCGEQMLLI